MVESALGAIEHTVLEMPSLQAIASMIELEKLDMPVMHFLFGRNCAMT